MTARVRLSPSADRIVVVEAEELRVGVVALPASLVNWVVRNYDPFPRLASRSPVPVEVGAISVTPDGIRIASGR